MKMKPKTKKRIVDIGEEWAKACARLDLVKTEYDKSKPTTPQLQGMEKAYFDSLAGKAEGGKELVSEEEEQVRPVDPNVVLGVKHAVGFKCRKCNKKDKTSWTMRQTRSGDEGMTTYVNCARCRITWTIAA